MKFDGHDSDVNAVRFYPTCESIGTASNDGTVRHQVILKFKAAKLLSNISVVCLTYEPIKKLVYITQQVYYLVHHL